MMSLRESHFLEIEPDQTQNEQLANTSRVVWCGDTNTTMTHADLEALILEQKNHLPPPQGVSEEVAVDVGKHTPAKNFKKI